MDSETGLYVLVGASAGAFGYYAWTQSGLFGGIATLFAVGWIIFSFFGFEEAWDTLGSLTHPPTAAIFALIVGTAYYALRGNPLPGNLTFGIGLALIGFVIGKLLYNFWNLA